MGRGHDVGDGKGLEEEGCGNGGRWNRGLGGEVEVNVAEREKGLVR
ncbi:MULTISPECIES: hypothetical protein [Eisenbergiella]|nr:MULTISPECIES: hypothetical protein [Eisenbergiella]MCI6708432.1 hypothetical protein [Eisenbergiella massiliensis]MDY2651890.1 hypothetical protein [Eisenbergiella porci]MDY5524660.1 hypothetical protein [Eisenbergiella porci]